MKTVKGISKGLMIAVGLAIAASSLTACKEQKTVIREVEKPKEPDLQFKVKTDGSGVDVNVEGKIEDKK